MPPNEPLVTGGHRRRFRFAGRLSRGARSSPLGLSAGWLILLGRRPRHNGEALYRPEFERGADQIARFDELAILLDRLC